MSIDTNNFTLSAEQQLHLARISESVGKLPAEVLDQLLQQFPLPTAAANGSENPRTLYDAFAADGSIGMIKDGPTDVSTNPKYIEGFGRSGR
jgi:hypothetical protein